jgi:hypothetical protein
MRISIIDDISSAGLHEFTENTVEKGSIIVTGSWRGYNEISEKGYSNYRRRAECGITAYSYDNFINEEPRSKLRGMDHVFQSNGGYREHYRGVLAQKNILDIILMNTPSGSTGANRTVEGYYLIDYYRILFVWIRSPVT